MKKWIYIIVCMALVLSSCNKDVALAEDIEASGTPSEVSFTVEAFNSEVVNMTKFGQQTNSDTIQHCYLYLYDSEGKWINQVNSRAEELPSGITTINFSKLLSPGSYTAEIVATNVKDKIYSTNPYRGTGFSSLSHSSSQISHVLSLQFLHVETLDGSAVKAKEFTNRYYHDIFYSKVNFTVTGNTTVNVPLSRSTGRLEVNFTDIKPATSYPINKIAYVRVKIENLPYWKSLGKDVDSRGEAYHQGIPFYSGNSTDYHYYLTQAEWDQFKTRPMVINCMPTLVGRAPKITLEFSYDYADFYKFNTPTMWHTCEISGFQVYKNKITRLTGEAFSGADFGITVDTNWDDTVEGSF